MDIEFDPAKETANIAKHGVSLVRLADLEILVAEVDDRFAYGETRYRAFGIMDGLPFMAAFTVTAEGLRAISLRRAHLKEFDRYV